LPPQKSLRAAVEEIRLRFAGLWRRWLATMTEDDVIRHIQALVAAGEYVDELLGLPGVRLSGGGAFKDNRRIYGRGTPEHLQARAAGVLAAGRGAALSRARPDRAAGQYQP
jgi:hypothetical protein